MSELTEALAGLESRLKAAIPTVEQVAEAAMQKLLPLMDTAVKGAVSDAGPIGALVSTIADPLIDDVEAYIQGLLTGAVPPTTTETTVQSLSKKVAALTVVTGSAGAHALAVTTAAIAKLPAPAPAAPKAE